MTYEEKRILWDKVRSDFCGSSLGRNNYLGSNKLSKLLETVEWYDWAENKTYPMSERLKHQLELLTGPHGATLFKVLLARNVQKN